MGAFYQAMAQRTYAAGIAGLGWSVSCSETGFNVRVQGYDDKLANFATEVILSCLTADGGSSVVRDEDVERVKERKIRGYRSYWMERPDGHALYYKNTVLHPGLPSVDEMEVEVAAVTPDDIRSWLRGSLMGLEGRFIEMVYMGNVGEDEAVKVFDMVGNVLGRPKAAPLSLTHFLGSQMRQLPPGAEYHIHTQSRNEKEENGAVTIFFQSHEPAFTGHGDDSGALKRTAAMMLLGGMIKEVSSALCRKAWTHEIAKSTLFAAPIQYPADQAAARLYREQSHQ